MQTMLSALSLSLIGLTTLTAVIQLTVLHLPLKTVIGSAVLALLIYAAIGNWPLLVRYYEVEALKQRVVAILSDPDQLIDLLGRQIVKTPMDKKPYQILAKLLKQHHRNQQLTALELDYSNRFNEELNRVGL